jgi:hypothetical protein
MLFAKSNGVTSERGGGYVLSRRWKDLTAEMPSRQPTLQLENELSMYDADRSQFDTRLFKCDACLKERTASQPLYHQLPSGDWLRLIIIEPGSFDESIKCQLKCASRSEVESQYEALSYSWHDNDLARLTPEEKRLYEPWNISCNGVQVSIQQNLWRAIQRLRYLDRPRAVWADALCIDQSNDLEKAQQVQVMSLIYSGANRTLIWMGESQQDNVDSSLDLVCRIINRWDNRHPATYFRIDDNSMQTSIRRPTGPVATESDESYTLSTMFGLSWFRRKWVIQEAVLSRSCEIIFQNCRISWYWVGLAAAILRNQTIENLYINIPAEEGIYNAYFMFRLSDHEGLPAIKLTFLQLLRLSTNFKASDPRDAIFALLGIETKDHHPQKAPFIEVDYTLDAETLFQKVAERFLTLPEPLKFIVNAEFRPKRLDTSTKHSSWVPKWGNKAGFMLSPWSLDEKFSPADGLSFQRKSTDEVTHLVVKGIELSTVLFQLPHYRNIKLWELIACGEPALISIKTLEFFSHTLTCGRNSYGGRETQQRALLPHLAACICADKERFSTRMPTVSDRILDISNIKVLAEGGAPEIFEEAAKNVSHNTSLFLTTSGHIGLGPSEMVPGDVVCVLGGADMPMVLRKNDDCYNLVGECYIDDIMEGQAVKAIKLGKSHRGPFNTRDLIHARLASKLIPEKTREPLQRVQEHLMAVGDEKYAVLKETWIDIR